MQLLLYCLRSNHILHDDMQSQLHNHTTVPHPAHALAHARPTHSTSYTALSLDSYHDQTCIIEGLITRVAYPKIKYWKLHELHKNGVTSESLRSRASRVLIQLACYAQVLFSSCTVNFREPIDLLRKSIRHRGKCRGSLASACQGVVVRYVGEVSG